MDAKELTMRGEYDAQHRNFPGLDWFTWQIAWNAAALPSDAAQAPDGWKLVPQKPTEAMLNAGVNAAVGCKNAKPWCPPLWNAMLDAAPVAPAEAAPQPYALRFPTMLQKMWSGSEVQAWLDELPPLYEVPTLAVDGSNGNASLIGGAAPVELVQSTPEAAQPDKRTAFEAWAKPRGYDLTRCSPVAYAAYKSDFTNGALAGWLGALDSLPRLSTETVDNPVQILSDVAHEMPRFEAAMRAAFDYTPERNPFGEVVPHAEEAYQFGRDCDRFMGWCMGVQRGASQSSVMLTADRVRSVFNEKARRVEDCHSGIDEDDLEEFIVALFGANRMGASHAV